MVATLALRAVRYGDRVPGRRRALRSNAAVTDTPAMPPQPTITHRGYVIKGRLRVRYSDHDEVISTGDVYYLAPGHIPVVEEPLEVVEFSPLADYQKTTAALMA
jgi:hypothetical protein